MLRAKVDSNTLIAERRDAVGLCLRYQERSDMSALANEVRYKLHFKHLFQAALPGIAILGCIAFHAGESAGGRYN